MKNIKSTFKLAAKSFKEALGYHDDMDPFLRQIFPLLIIYRATGRCPFRTNKYGKLEIKLISFSGLYYVFAFGLISLIILDSFLSSNIIDYFTEDNLTLVIIGLTGIVIAVLHFISNLADDWNATMNYFRDWNSLNVNFNKIIGSREPSRYLKVAVACFVAFGLGSFGSLFTPRPVFFGLYWYHQCVPPMYFTANAMVLALFTISCYECITMSCAINSKLKSLLKNERLTALELYSVRRLWIQLALLVRKTGSGVTLPIVFDIACSTSFISFAAFGAFFNIITNNGQISPFIIITIISTLKVFNFYETGEQITHYVGRRIIETLSTAKLLNMDYSTMEEVEIFIQSINSIYPEVYLGGLIKVSRGELTSVLFGAMTYVLVLIQIQLSKIQK